MTCFRNFTRLMRGIIVHIAVWVLTASISFAQSSYESTVLPRSGDTIFSLVDNLPTQINVGDPGEDRFWDFSSLQSPFVRKYVFQPTDRENELLIKKNSGSLKYTLRDNDLYLSSISNADPLLIGSSIEFKSAPALLEYANPIKYNSASSEYARLIAYLPWQAMPEQFHMQSFDMEDTLRLTLEINRDDAVDAWGTLLLRNEKYNVVRERRIEEQVLTVWAKDRTGEYVNITSILKAQLNDVVWESVTYSYLFLADGFPGPIAEVYTDENDRPEKVIFSAKPRFAKYISPTRRLSGVYVYPNPSFGNVRFEFFNIRADEYELSVYNLLGKKMWSTTEQLKNESVIATDLSFLKRGTYFYSLTDKNGKRLVTRRLMILKA